MTTSRLAASLGLWTSISLVVGGIIGSGIFMKPASMAAQLGSPSLLLTVWVVAGIITLFGALSNAEIATMFPETGGQFVFFKVMYGDFFAFLYGWAAFAVFNTAGVASIAYVFGTYSQYFIDLPAFSANIVETTSITLPGIGRLYPLDNFGVKAITIAVIVLLTLINYRSTNFGGNIQVLFTILKVLAMLLVIFGFFISPQGSAVNLWQSSAEIKPEGWALAGAFVAALSGAFWGYDGWNNITFVAGEIKDPQTVIPKSLFLGICICALVYVAMNAAFLYILPIEEIASSAMVATDAAFIVIGSGGAMVIAALVILSTFGTTNGNILATARVSFAMARTNQFFASVGRIHPRFGTPGNALLLHGSWTSVLVISGSFDILTDMLIFVSWLFYGMSALGIFVLRKKLPQQNRPYSVWGYPVVPAVFVLFTFSFLIGTLINDVILFQRGDIPVINSLLGLLLTFLGVPIYWLVKDL